MKIETWEINDLLECLDYFATDLCEEDTLNLYLEKLEPEIRVIANLKLKELFEYHQKVATTIKNVMEIEE